MPTPFVSAAATHTHTHTHTHTYIYCRSLSSEHLLSFCLFFIPSLPAPPLLPLLSPPLQLPPKQQQFTSKIALAHHLRTNRPDLYDRHFPALLEEPPLVRKRYPYLFVSQIQRLHAATADADEQSFYYVPGQGAIKLKWQRPKKGVGRPRSQYDCPNKVCSGVFARIDELAHHLTNGCCIPTRGKLTGMQRDWTESDGELLAIADPPVYQDAQEALKIADRPQMTRYQWPQDSSGIWCLTENAAFNCFNVSTTVNATVCLLPPSFFLRPWSFVHLPIHPSTHPPFVLLLPPFFPSCISSFRLAWSSFPWRGSVQRRSQDGKQQQFMSFHFKFFSPY